jgi:hypothetical protein
VVDAPRKGTYSFVLAIANCLFGLLRHGDELTNSRLKN